MMVTRDMKARSFPMLVGLIVCCTASHAEEVVVKSRRLFVAEPLPLIQLDQGDAVIFPPAFGDDLLSQCSRHTLGKGDAYWTPVETDIEAAERILFEYMKDNRPAAEPLRDWPDLTQYHRQYVGVVRGQQRTIYASFVPVGDPGHDNWRQYPSAMCDSGPWYFGVEIDLAAASIVDISFGGGPVIWLVK